jgi:alpha-1,6-mannosyltransferase
VRLQRPRGADRTDAERQPQRTGHPGRARGKSRKNGTIQAATPTDVLVADTTRLRASARAGAERLLGVLGVLGVLFTAFGIAAGAAGGPSQYVPADSGGWPSWLAGPLRGVGLGLSGAGFEALMLAMCASYLLVLLGARSLSMRTLGGAIALTQLILVLGPPLISQDVFGYEAFARLGALHGLNPYSHFAAEVPSDPVFGFVGWPFAHSPYGPLFTLSSYATVPLGLAGGLWAIKLVTLAASLVATWMCALAAERKGGSATSAAAFVGLNPVLLVLALGGAHNDLIVIALLSLALLLLDRRPRGAVATVVTGVGVKITAGLVLPFLVLGAREWRERLSRAGTAAVALVVVLAIAALGFGLHALGFVSALGEQQELIATHSVPAETARLFGLSGTPGWWQHLFLAAFVVVLAVALWRTHRGADWTLAAGWSTLALLVCTTHLLPWYAVWLLPLAAVGSDRRLRAATLLFCAYAVLIHLPLANSLLSPGASAQALAPHPGVSFTLLGERLEFTGLEVLRHTTLDLRF